MAEYASGLTNREFNEFKEIVSETIERLIICADTYNPCSNCGDESTEHRNFCPNCGADMRGDSK